MTTKTAERRSKARASAAYPVAVCDRRGRTLARGRTADISESGVFVVLRAPKALPRAGRLLLRIELPKACQPHGGRAAREVRYAAEVVRTEPLGQMLGVGLKLIEKLG